MRNACQWYQYLGHHDRHFEQISDFGDLAYAPWTDALPLIWNGTVNRRSGFTADSRYLKVAESIGIVDVWEQRRPPDICEQVEDEWFCD